MKLRVNKNTVIACGVVLAIGAIAALSVFSERIARDSVSLHEASNNVLSLPPAQVPADKSQTASKEELPEVLGIVEDEEGNPIHRALVRAIHIASDVYQYEVAVAETLADGTYSHDGLLLNERYKLIADSPGFLPSSSGEFLLQKRRTEINFTLAKEKPVELEVDHELESIIAGARASANRFYSGRLVYTAVSTTQPIHYTDEQIESHIKKQEEIYRSDPLSAMSDGQIQYLLARERENLLAQQKRTEPSTGSYSGEYVFEGNKSYHVVLLYRGRIMKRYVYDNKATVFDNEGGEISATITKREDALLSELRSPLHHFLRLISSLSVKEWKISNVERTGGGMAYTLQRTLNGAESEIVILPENSYYVDQYRSRDKSGRYALRLSFANMKWNPDLGGYYPSEVREETYRNTSTIYLEEVEFNKDYDDNIFQPVFEDGMTIIDKRFDPPRKLKYTYPDLQDKYFQELDEKMRALKN